MRIESSVTSVSWIPSEAVEGVAKLPFEMVAQYDQPPPDVLRDLEGLRARDAFRFANELRAWIDIKDGKIVKYGQSGKGHFGATKLRLASHELSFAGVALPELRPGPAVRERSVRFVQTVGGRAGVPAPRPVRRKPFIQVSAPVWWTTLALTINVDGSSQHELVGASPFPRHWIYDDAGRLSDKTGLIDFKTWARDAFGRRTPWGGGNSEALVTKVERALEREVSRHIMQGKPRFRRLAPGKTLVRQGEPGTELYLLLDGVLTVAVDGRVLAEVGPGAIVGERALLEGGRRTATLTAATPARVAVVSPDQVMGEPLAELARGHGQEEPPRPR
jgi:hypothetical protein